MWSRSVRKEKVRLWHPRTLEIAMAVDSLKRRYAAKLLTNLVGFGIGMVTQVIIPRGLGPKAYGDFNFLSSFFNEVVAFFDMGTSTGLYTKLSQRQKEAGIVIFYLGFALLTSALLFILVAILSFTPYAFKIWPDQERFYIYLAALWGILTWFIQILTKIVDAYGLTVSGEIARNMQRFFGLVLILVLFYYEKLNLKNFFFTTMRCLYS